MTPRRARPAHAPTEPRGDTTRSAAVKPLYGLTARDATPPVEVTSLIASAASPECHSPISSPQSRRTASSARVREPVEAPRALLCLLLLGANLRQEHIFSGEQCLDVFYSSRNHPGYTKDHVQTQPWTRVLTMPSLRPPPSGPHKRKSTDRDDLGGPMGPRGRVFGAPLAGRPGWPRLPSLSGWLAVLSSAGTSSRCHASCQRAARREHEATRVSGQGSVHGSANRVRAVVGYDE